MQSSSHRLAHLDADGDLNREVSNKRLSRKKLANQLWQEQRQNRHHDVPQEYIDRDEAAHMRRGILM
jgi:hypothetical protein